MSADKQEPAEQPSAASLVRMDGWVRYCEYFHLLDADMQATTQLSAQRYDKSGDLFRSFASGGPSLEQPREHDACFAHIARAIEQHDKPLELKGEADLGLVHARLRAAAHSSNLRAAASADTLEVSREAEALLRSAKPRKRAQQDSDSCAAAVETHLWFGLALGDADGAAAAAPASDAERKRPVSRGLADWTLDWSAAMSEAGLSDEFEAKEALEALEVVQVADEAVRALSMEADAEEAAAEAAEAAREAAAAELEAATQQAARLEGTYPADAADEARRAPGHAAADDRFDSQSEAGSDDSVPTLSAEIDAEAANGADSGDEAANDASDGADGATRRSRRAPKKPREWTSLQPAPLLKLEKLKKQKPLPLQRKRSGADYETDSGSESAELATPKTVVGDHVCDGLGLYHDAARSAAGNKRQRWASAVR